MNCIITAAATSGRSLSRTTASVMRPTQWVICACEKARIVVRAPAGMYQLAPVNKVSTCWRRVDWWAVLNGQQSHIRLEIFNWRSGAQMLQGRCTFACGLFFSDRAGVQVPYIAYPRFRRYLSWPRPRTPSSLSQSRPRLFGVDWRFRMFPSSKHRRRYSATAGGCFSLRFLCNFSATLQVQNYSCIPKRRIERRSNATSTGMSGPLHRYRSFHH